MKLARNLDEFLKYAPRTPSAITTAEDRMELPEKPGLLSSRAYFNTDAVDAFNKVFSLERLREAGLNRSLPAHLRRELAVATWVRAVLLDNERIALELAPVLKELFPEIWNFIQFYVNSPSPDARKFAGIIVLLKYPGMRPFVGVGLSRLTPLSRIDNFRDNWWCALGNLYYVESPPDFLSEREKDTAHEERSKLIKIETAPNYLGKKVIEWAKNNPRDPRIPEALHLVVRATRYGCGNDETRNLSRLAFKLLHEKYPKSEWTKKTPYWF